jgi:hypothetical protein
MKNDNIIYSLTIEDIQIVANHELGRDLTSNEIEKIKDTVAEKLLWYDAIADSIIEKLDPVEISH